MILLTNFRFYSFKKDKIARVVPIEKIEAFTKSNVKESFTFILHFENEYDYELSTFAKNGQGFFD